MFVGLGSRQSLLFFLLILTLLLRFQYRISKTIGNFIFVCLPLLFSGYVIMGLMVVVCQSYFRKMAVLVWLNIPYHRSVTTSGSCNNEAQLIPFSCFQDKFDVFRAFTIPMQFVDLPFFLVPFSRVACCVGSLFIWLQRCFFWVLWDETFVTLFT